MSLRIATGTDGSVKERKGLKRKFAAYAGPVSYTHLDVYKRQSSAIEAVLEAGDIPLLIDPKGKSIELLKPDVVVEAIIAKKNLGTTINMAPLVIGVGPGFTAAVSYTHLDVYKRQGCCQIKLFSWRT